MKSKTLKALFLGCSLAWPMAHAAEQDVTSIVKAVDLLRTGKDALQIETQVTTLSRDGASEKVRNYTVFAQNDRKSLVLMRSPAEQGQKLLMLGDDFWLVLPSSQRPLRITASQKLLGDASAGDIATMRWSDDYTGTLTAEEQCGEQACLRLALAATSKGTSYSRIDLWVGKVNNEPLRADLYVQSGKLAKRAVFVLDNPKAPTYVNEMVLADQLSDLKETRIKYVSRKRKTVPVEWLNPTFLATNPALE
jgi:outer membrane lipoprotein-sorting protein